MSRWRLSKLILYRDSTPGSLATLGLVSRSGVARPVEYRQDFADAVPVRDFHRERQAALLDLDLVSGFRDAADAVIDQTPDRVVFLGILEIPELNVEHLRHVIDRRPPVDASLVIGQTDRQRLFGVVLVLDVADYLLEQILDRDHSGRAAVLVEYDGQGDSATLQLVEKVVDGHRLGCKKGRPEKLAEVRLWPARLEKRQQVLRVEDADDLVHRLLVHRNAAVALRDEGVDDLFHGGRDRQGRHVGPRDHDLMDAAAAQLDDGADHLLFLSLEDAGLPSPLDDELQLFCVDLSLAGNVGPEATGDPPRQPRQHIHDGGEDVAHDIQRASERQRHAVRIGQRECLGNQLAENDGEGGQEAGDNEDGEAARWAPQRFDAGDHVRELFRQVHGCVRGGEEADERDPDLSHGQEAAWVLDEVLDATRSAMALIHQLVYAAVAQGNEGNLGGHEHRLDGDEDEDYQQLKEDVTHRSAPSVAGSSAAGAGVTGASAVTSTRGFRRRAGQPP